MPPRGTGSAAGSTLLGATVETLLNDRLRDLELRQRLAAVHTEMQALQRARRMRPADRADQYQGLREPQPRPRCRIPRSPPSSCCSTSTGSRRSTMIATATSSGTPFAHRGAGAVRDCAPEGAVVGRLGGDEFGVVLPLDQPEEPAALRRRLDAFTNAILRVTAPWTNRAWVGSASEPRSSRDAPTMNGSTTGLTWPLCLQVRRPRGGNAL